MKTPALQIYFLLIILLNSCSNYSEQSGNPSLSKPDIKWKEYSSEKFGYKISCPDYGDLNEEFNINNPKDTFEISSRVLCVSNENVFSAEVYTWKKSDNKPQIEKSFLHALKNVGSLSKQLASEKEVSQNNLHWKELVFVGEKELINEAFDNFPAKGIIDDRPKNYVKKRVFINGDKIYVLEFDTINLNKDDLSELTKESFEISEKFFNSFQIRNLIAEN